MKRKLMAVLAAIFVAGPAIAGSSGESTSNQTYDVTFSYGVSDGSAAIEQGGDLPKACLSGIAYLEPGSTGVVVLYGVRNRQPPWTLDSTTSLVTVSSTSASGGTPFTTAARYFQAAADGNQTGSGQLRIKCNNVAGLSGILRIDRETLHQFATNQILTTADMDGKLFIVSIGSGSPTITFPEIFSTTTDNRTAYKGCFKIVTSSRATFFPHADSHFVLEGVALSNGVGIETTGTASAGGLDAMLCVASDGVIVGPLWANAPGTTIDRWQVVGAGKGGAADLTTGTAVPTANCDPGDYYTRTPSGAIYVCTASNTWTLKVA